MTKLQKKIFIKKLKKNYKKFDKFIKWKFL